MNVFKKLKRAASLGNLLLLLNSLILSSCQSFTGPFGGSRGDLLKDDGISNAAPTALTPAQELQLKQHQLAIKIKKAGGDVTTNLALYPASTVVGVDLHQTKITDADLSQLHIYPNLRIVNLFGTRVTDAGLANLVSVINLQTLYLDSTAITDVGLLQIQKCQNLHELGLDRTQVTDAGLASLATMKNLTELTLSGPQITDVGLKRLVVLTHLKKLVLTKTSVTKAAIEQFQKALPDTHVFHS